MTVGFLQFLGDKLPCGALWGAAARRAAELVVVYNVIIIVLFFPFLQGTSTVFVLPFFVTVIV